MGAFIAYYGRGLTSPATMLPTRPSGLMMPEPVKEPNPFESPESESTREAKVSGMPQAAFAGTFVAAIVSVLIVVGLFFVTPGLGVLAALVLVPANLRAILLMRKAFQATGNWPLGWSLASAFVISTLIMIPIWIATGIAFYAVCWAGAMIAVSVFPKADEYGLANMLYGGVPIGLIAGLVSFVICFRLTLQSNFAPTDIEDSASKQIS